MQKAPKETRLYFFASVARLLSMQVRDSTERIKMNLRESLEKLWLNVTLYVYRVLHEDMIHVFCDTFRIHSNWRRKKWRKMTGIIFTRGT